MRLGRIALVLTLLAAPACIETDESVTIYLQPDGRLQLVAYLDDLHSDAKDAAEHAKEERELLANLKAGKLFTPELVKKGAKDVETRLIRASVPYAAVVSGTFDEPIALFRTFDFNSSIGGKTAVFSKEGTRRKLLFAFPAVDKPSASDDRTDFPRRLKIILTSGRFAEGKGFRLDSERRSCVIDEAKYAAARRSGKPFEMSIAW